MKKYCNSKRSAFSLLELSIIILIIGVIITGVMQGQHILYESRLKTARSLTNSSIVSSIPSLVLWLEATSENSFIPGQGGDGEDGDAVTKWLDINPQTINKIEMTGTGTYKSESLSGLPAINFSGSNIFTTSDLADFQDQYTIFVVIKVTGGSTIISKTNGSLNNGANFHLDYHSTNVYRYCDGANCGASPSISVPYPHIIASTFDISQPIGKQIVLFLNSYSQFSARPDAATALVQGGGEFRIGNTSATYSLGAITGDIGEIIMFNKRLSTRDFNAVTKYLGNKWRIQISN